MRTATEPSSDLSARCCQCAQFHPSIVLSEKQFHTRTTKPYRRELARQIQAVGVSLGGLDSVSAILIRAILLAGVGRVRAVQSHQQASWANHTYPNCEIAIGKQLEQKLPQHLGC